MTNKIMHMDADSMIYQIAYYSGDNESMDAMESGDDDDFEGLDELAEVDNSWVLDEVQKRVDDLLKITKCDDYVLHFTASSKNADIFEKLYGRKMEPQFRWAVASDLPDAYKHNRTSEPPEDYELILQTIVDNFKSVLHDVWEADDAVVAYKDADPDNTTIVALDKDVLNQATGVHWNYQKNQPQYTTPEEATFYKYWQCIVGDPSDGYKGVPGIGKVGAKKFIQPEMSEAELWSGVIEAYKSKGLGYKEAIATLRLADMTQVKLVEGVLQLALVEKERV